MRVHSTVLFYLVTQTVLQPAQTQIVEVARRRKNYATQIDTYLNRPADLALDGDTNPDYNAGHCAHPRDPRQQDFAWWMVDLGTDYAVYNLTIYSSISPAGWDLLGYISVRVSDSADISEHTVSEQCAVWDERPFPEASHETLVCDQVMYGRYVSIQRTGGDLTYNMILCEVMIMGSKLASLGLPSERPIVSSVTDYSADVKWKKIINVPSGLSDRYEYAIEYRTDSSSWVEWQPRHSHDPSSDQYQQATLTSLTYDTRYRVRLRSYRVHGDRTERTGTTPEQDLDTKCTSPEKPRNLKITSADRGNKVSLTITWEAAPAYSDCRRIADYNIKYRLASAGEKDWINSIDLDSDDTSCTLPDLDPDNYVLRLIVTNNGGIVNYKEIATQYKTLCKQCDDNVCESGKPCQNCEPGFKSPECRYTCDDRKYGVNCAEDCSDGCEDTCDRVSGKCSCQQWWTGSKCTNQIEQLRTSTEKPTVSSLDDSSAVIQWKKITSVPAALSDHYQYVIEYKEEASSDWQEWQTRHSHDPSSDQYQEATLTGLMYNTVYDVRVKSYRVLGGEREKTGVSGENTFQTDCKAPSEPQAVLVKSLDKETKSVLNVTWKHPKEIGCNNITKYTIMYRLLSPSSQNWKLQDTLPAASTSHTFELDKGTYAIRIEVTNDGNSSNYAEMTDPNPGGKHSPSGGGDTGLIAGLVAGVLILVILLGVLGFIWYRNKQVRDNKNKSQVQQGGDSPNEVVDSSLQQQKLSTEQEMTPVSSSIVLANLEEMPENQYERPVLYENAGESMGRTEYETLRVPVP